MADFQPITTQEEFDNAIKARIERERAKFADYESFKTQNNELQTKVNTLTKSLEEMNAKASEFDKTLAEKDTVIKGYEIKEMRQKVAIEKNIPFEMIDRIKGSTLEEMTEDAENLSAFFGKRSPAPPYNPEPRPTPEDTTTASVRSLVRNLSK